MKTKFRISKLFRRRQNKLGATTLRRQLRTAATVKDYEEMSEPNMKLSRALLIVLLLHLVAVSGIIAFNAIKTRQAATVATSPSDTNTVKAAVGSTVKPVGSPMATTVGERATNKPLAKEIGKTDRTKKTDATKSVSDSHRTYVVAKGDNPVAIAKKFKVSYDDLLALNHIENPRKLQIGQKLLIPSKATKSKKSDE